jgi:hypothetical protein
LRFVHGARDGSGRKIFKFISRLNIRGIGKCKSGDAAFCELTHIVPAEMAFFGRMFWENPEALSGKAGRAYAGRTSVFSGIWR